MNQNNGNGNGKNHNPNRRWLGKIKNQQSQYGTFQKLMVDNPYPNNQDGTPNTYHKGHLLWLDAETGKKFLVKQVKVVNPSEAQRQKGIAASLCIDLDDQYHVQELG